MTAPLPTPSAQEAGTIRVDQAPQLLRELSSLLPRVSAPLHALLTDIPKASCPRSDKVSNTTAHDRFMQP